MSLKANINKLHSDLLGKYEDVTILEKSNMKFGNYFEITVNENSKTLKMVITKKSAESDNFDWSYYSNPESEDSVLVERKSNTSNFINVVNDIFEKNRFDSDYLEKIK